MKNLITLLVCLFSVFPVFSQNYTQTVRGKITDEETLHPVAFATVAVIVNETLLGTISDEAGNYQIDHVPVGRATIRISMVGYEIVIIQNMEVSSGRESVVNAGLKRSITQLNGVEVRSAVNKEKPLNAFATASARTFSVEEAQRYAGASYDVSRLAMNFAGVKSTDDTQNEIVIRGNSPIGMLFRLDGIDIPNPNHFGDGSASGGILSMLNVNTLANSDFITGAFPAEYNNTISGVFDMRLRNGNDQKHEFIGQMALGGVELSVEGPLSRDNGSSYLVNYRYSTSGLLDAVVDLHMAAMPTYQDGVFKMNFPSKGKGTTSLIGIGGNSRIEWLESILEPSQEAGMQSELNYDTDFYINNKIGTLGITHTHLLNERSYLRLVAWSSVIENSYRVDSVSTENQSLHLWSGSHFRRNRNAVRFFVNIRMNSRNNFRAGFTLERQDFALNDSIRDSSIEGYRVLLDANGNDFLASPYLQWQHRFNQHIHLNMGLNINYQHSTGHAMPEPRLGLGWEFVQGQTLSFAYGLHSLATPIEVLQSRVMQEDGSYSFPNKDAGFTLSHHYILGYEKMFTPGLRFKPEIYYQHIVNALVEAEPGSFSLLNRRSGSDFDFGALVNEGTGYNYGLEITAEKFMHRGSYFLSTLSLFESKYRGSDKVLRNTAFNGNYVFNFLAGKEFRIGTGQGRYIKLLNIDGKFIVAGGQRHAPIDMEATRQARYIQYNETQAYSEQLPAYLSVNLRAGIKFVGRSSTQEIALSISNVTNRKNPFFLKYDPASDTIQTYHQFGIMPDILYRIVF